MTNQRKELFLKKYFKKYASISPVTNNKTQQEKVTNEETLYMEIAGKQSTT